MREFSDAIPDDSAIYIGLTSTGSSAPFMFIQSGAIINNDDDAFADTAATNNNLYAATISEEVSDFGKLEGETDPANMVMSFPTDPLPYICEYEPILE